MESTNRPKESTKRSTVADDSSGMRRSRHEQRRHAEDHGKAYYTYFQSFNHG